MDRGQEGQGHVLAPEQMMVQELVRLEDARPECLMEVVRHDHLADRQVVNGLQQPRLKTAEQRCRQSLTRPHM